LNLNLKKEHGSTRVSNSLKVLDLLIDKPMSRIDLAYETGLTKTTIGEIVRDFIGIGFLEEVKTSPNRVGRPSMDLKLVKDFAHVLGIGIMRDGVNGCLIDSEGEELYRASYSYEKNTPAIETVYMTCDNLMRKAELTGREVKAISFGVPGPLDTERGVIKEPPKLSEFANFPLIKEIKERYKVFACIENDADMGAMGEKYYGKGKDLDSFIYILYDKGIGAGIIINNQLYHGLNGYAGEIGHTLIIDNGKFTYFEDEYGIDKVIEQINKKISIPIKNIRELENLSQEDKIKILDFQEELAKNFSQIILSLIHYFGISNIFLDGRIKYLGNNFINQLRKIVRKYLFHKHEVKISFSNLDEYAVSLGAAKFGLIRYLYKQVKSK